MTQHDFYMLFLYAEVMFKKTTRFLDQKKKKLETIVDIH